MGGYHNNKTVSANITCYGVWCCGMRVSAMTWDDSCRGSGCRVVSTADGQDVCWKQNDQNQNADDKYCDQYTDDCPTSAAPEHLSMHTMRCLLKGCRLRHNTTRHSCMHSQPHQWSNPSFIVVSLITATCVVQVRKLPLPATFCIHFSSVSLPLICMHSALRVTLWINLKLVGQCGKRRWLVYTPNVVTLYQTEIYYTL